MIPHSLMSRLPASANRRRLVVGAVLAVAGVAVHASLVDRLLWALSQPPSASAGDWDTRLYLAALWLPLLGGVLAAVVAVAVGGVRNGYQGATLSAFVVAAAGAGVALGAAVAFAGSVFYGTFWLLLFGVIS